MKSIATSVSVHYFYALKSESIMRVHYRACPECAIIVQSKNSSRLIFSINYATPARHTRSEVFVLLGQRHLGGLLGLGLDLGHVVGVQLEFAGGEQGRLDEHQVGVVGEAAQEPHEGLLELVVALGGDVVVLEVLLAVEGDLLGLDLAVLDIDLVAHEHDGDVLADASQVLVPLGHVGVGDARADVEHDDAAVAADVVAVAQASELFLARGIPHVEQDLPMVREEGHRVNFNTKCGDVLLFELTSQVALNEGRLADASITH